MDSSYDNNSFGEMVSYNDYLTGENDDGGEFQFNSGMNSIDVFNMAGTTNSGGFALQLPAAQQSTTITTPPAPIQPWNVQAAPITVSPASLQALQSAPVITPTAPQAANNGTPANNLQWQTPNTAGTPSRKSKVSKSKKQRRILGAGEVTASVPDYSTHIASLSSNPNFGLGIGMMQPQHVAVTQQMPQSYQISTNPAHAHLLQGPQMQHFTPPQANMSFNSRPLVQMQNGSLPAPQQQQAQYFSTPPMAQQQQSALPLPVPSANLAPPAQENTLNKAMVAVYNDAAIMRLPSMSLLRKQDGMLDQEDLSIYITAAEMQLEALRNPDFAHAKSMLDVYTAAGKAELDMLASPPNSLPQAQLDAAFLEIQTIAAEAHLMFLPQSQDSLEFFLSCDAGAKNKVVGDMIEYHASQPITKRKRTAGAIEEGALYSPFTESFMNDGGDLSTIFEEPDQQEEEARLEWEAANAKREEDDGTAAAQETVDIVHKQPQHGVASLRAVAMRESTPSSPGLGFSDFEDDDEPAEDTQDELENLTRLSGVIVEDGTVVEPTVTVAPEVASPISRSPITTSAFQEDSDDENEADEENEADDDLCSLFGEDEEESIIPVAVPTIGGLPRSSFPSMMAAPLPKPDDTVVQQNQSTTGGLDSFSFPSMTAAPLPKPVNAIVQEDEEVAQTAEQDSLDAFNDPNSNVFDDFQFDMNNAANLPSSGQHFGTFDQASFTDPTDTSFIDGMLWGTSMGSSQGLSATGGQVGDGEQSEVAEQTVAADDSSWSSPAVQHTNSMPQAQQASPQQQPSVSYQPMAVPSQQYGTPQQSAPTQQYSSAPPQAQQTPQVVVDDSQDDLDAVMATFVNSAMNMMTPAPSQQQQHQLATQILPTLTAAGPERPLCHIFLSSNGAHCPYGSACLDRHYYLSGPSLTLAGAIGSQINYLATNAIDDRDMIREGLLVKSFKRGARLHCKNCRQMKPVTLKNDGVRCTPCFKRWCDGSN